MASTVGKVILTELAKEAVEAVPNIIDNTMNAPDKYTGLRALGYGLTKEAPWIDAFNEYPEAHPAYIDPKTKMEDIVPVQTSKQDALEDKIADKVVPHEPQTPIVTSTNVGNIGHTPVIATSYSGSEVKKSKKKINKTKYKIYNPFSGDYIDMRELVRLSRQSDSEGLWAKRKLLNYKNKPINKKVLLQ